MFGTPLLARSLDIRTTTSKPRLIVSWYFFISCSRPSIISDLISRRDRKSPPQSLICASTIDGSSEKIPSCRACSTARNLLGASVDRGCADQALGGRLPISTRDEVRDN